MKEYKNITKFPDIVLNQKSKILEELLKSNKKIIDFTNSNPTKLGFKSYIEIEKKLCNLKKFSFYEPHPKGKLKSRELISEYYKNLGRNINPEDIFLTSGSSESISYILKTFTKSNGEILIPKPGYPLYEYIIELENDGNFIEYYFKQTDELEWKIDFEDLEKKISKKTKGLILTSPNNPGGFILTENDNKKLKEILIQNEIILILDEVFSSYHKDYNYKNKFDGVNLFYLDGLSKSFGLPSFKLSWILIQGNEEFKKQISECLEIISDTYLTVNSFSENSLEILFKENLIGTEIKLLLNKNLEYLKKIQTEKYKFSHSTSCWSVLLKLNDYLEDEEVAINLLKKHHVNVHPGYLFALDNYIVISLLVQEEEFQLGIKKIIEYLS